MPDFQATCKMGRFVVCPARAGPSSRKPSLKAGLIGEVGDSLSNHVGRKVIYPQGDLADLRSTSLVMLSTKPL
jgi:hypothetical protein